MDPLFGGLAIFGTACKSVHIPRANQQQLDAFFGVNGNVTLYGGSRGRIHEITGVLLGVDLSEVLAAEATLLSYADGIARDYTDTQGRTFANTIFHGEYQPSPDGPRPAGDQGWCLPFRCVLHGLT
jgi:hypothetical protein